MAKQELPNLDNATPAYLIDEIGRMKDEYNRLEGLIKYYRAALNARQEEGKVGEGELYVKSPTWTEQTRLDQEKVKALLTPEQLAECQKTIGFWTTRFVPKPQENKDTSG